MEIDTDKIDETVLALLFLTSFPDNGFTRAWKGHDWDAMNRLSGLSHKFGDVSFSGHSG